MFNLHSRNLPEGPSITAFEQALMKNVTGGCDNSVLLEGYVGQTKNPPTIQNLFNFQVLNELDRTFFPSWLLHFV